MTRDVVVIGAGIGGLAAAIRLASAGLDVLVLEAGPRPGGKADVQVVDGVTFDTGPSLLTLPDVFDDLFAVAGTSLRREVELREVSPRFRYRWPDGVVLDVAGTVGETARAVSAALGPAAATELEAFLAYAKAIWDAAREPFLLGDPPTFGAMLRGGPTAWRGLAAVDAHHTMWDAIRSRVRSPHLRDLFARFATYNGSDPRRAPATLNCIAHVEMGLGGYGVKGGIAALVEALARVATRAGAEIRVDSRVTRILTERGRVSGVVAGEPFAARAVVCNADLGHLPDLLPAVPRVEIQQSMSGWNAVIRVPRGERPDAAAPRERAAHEVWFCADYEHEFADVFDRRRAPVDPTVYVCAPEVAHGRAGWREAEPLFLMVNAPPVSAGTTDADAVRRAALRRIGMPDAEVVWERTPAELARRFPGTGGAIYGAASNSAWSAFRRPSNRAAVPGLYAAGGSAHPGGGMPLCALSGAAAARALLADLGRSR